ncbi:flagellar hook-associated protein FlgK [Planctomycetota bacterium]
MGSFDIGLTGLDAARKALDVIGNNVANAATDGYHRQRANLTPSDPTFDGSFAWGTGVQLSSVTRSIDVLLEQEILSQQSSVDALTQELMALRTVETTFGEFGGGSALNDNIDEFFGALRDLAAHPNEGTWQRQFVRAAESMTFQFRMLGTSLTDIGTRLVREAQVLTNHVNALATELAALNQSIEQIEIQGAMANNLRDQRDAKVTELAKLIDIDTAERQYGVLDVSAGGIPIVVGSQTTELATELVDVDTLGIGAVGASNPVTTLSGGEIGGLFSARNTLIPEIETKLNSLAQAIADQINAYHVQGVGTGGSFASLTGENFGDSAATLASLDSDITAGDIQIRITNTSTGAITRETVTVAATTATLGSVVSDIDALTGISASIVNNQIQLVADAGYTFDFLPAVLPVPESGTLNLNGTSPPTIGVSGIYTDSSNKTFTATVSGTGDVGNGTLTVSVSDGTSAIATFNIGSGYAAGDILDMGNGIKITVSVGDVVNGDTFQIMGFTDTDSTGLLAAAGINTFFSGSIAETLTVVSRIQNDASLVATALGADYSDNTNAERLADLADTALSALNDLSAGDYYQSMVAEIGQDISVKSMRHENVTAVIQNLSTRRTEISGVDINEEAAKILMFEQMFQAMARFMNTVNDTMRALMDAM